MPVLKEFALRVGVDFGVAAVVVGAALWAGLGDRQALEHQLVTSQQHEQALESRLKTVETGFQQAATAFQSELARQEQARSASSSQRVTERFDPTSGKLVERTRQGSRTEATSSSTTRASTQDSQTATSTSTKTAEASTRSHTTESSTSTTTSRPADVRMGVSVGVIATGQGIGPAASYQLLSVGALHLDAVGAAVVTPGGLSPRLGVGVAAEVTPRLALTVAAFAAPAGDPLGVYHPLFPWVGLSPGLGLAYRF